MRKQNVEKQYCITGNLQSSEQISLFSYVHPPFSHKIDIKLFNLRNLLKLIKLKKKVILITDLLENLLS